MILAITGGTGFVGSHLIDHALEMGHTVRALARKPQAKRIGVTWVEGALDRPKSLATLVEGADVVIHVAGVVNAPDRAGFGKGNIAGTEGILQATKHAGIRRFVHVSSLAAREPALSNYGWSKAEAETRVQISGLDWTIVRPPAIFGPRDLELLDVFKAARSGYIPMPPAGTRVSLLYVEDLTALLLALAESADAPSIMEPDDGVPDGWDNRDFARAIGVAVNGAVGRSVKVFSTPRALLTLASAADRLVRRRKAKLTRDRVSYFCHPDWVSHKPPPPALWTPSVPTPQALAQTAAWYRAAGLL
ncbi:NAD(P)-dependent oxidoreductase [Sphingomonas albertensis]|uniref:NAD(P)-dependent oxidoreductase n=1 Tax=Sphingomonas albertensis TaxID=2762591 RepID=A0ABR7ASE4_9SPHN|nr:NAD(P)-dependent oxidoreductase [Sphingomonas albertensis]MBC3943381.1 NAD(P)-dependent oxidoreductase [Sphingomonas albertensis]